MRGLRRLGEAADDPRDEADDRRARAARLRRRVAGRRPTGHGARSRSGSAAPGEPRCSRCRAASRLRRVDDCSVFGSYGFAAVALAGTDVAWIVNEPHGYVGVVSEGASSATPRQTSTLVRAATGGGIVSPVGASVGGIAATSAGAALGHRAHRVPPDRSSTTGRAISTSPVVGCRTRVDGGGVFTWSRGVSTRVPGLPPSAALASAGNLLAVAARPRSRWIHGEARLASVQVRDARGRVVTSVTAPQEIDGLALSRQLLAVGDGLTSTVSVYAVPSGRFLRAVPVSREPSTRIAAVGRRLVLWDPQHVFTVDPSTGRRRTIVGFAAPTHSATGLLLDGDGGRGRRQPARVGADDPRRSQRRQGRRRRLTSSGQTAIASPPWDASSSPAGAARRDAPSSPTCSRTARTS